MSSSVDTSDSVGLAVGITVGKAAAVSTNDGFNFSSGTSGDLGGGLDLASVSGDAKKSGGESFH